MKSSTKRPSKETISAITSIIAIILSILSGIYSYSNSTLEKQRTLRSQLTDVVGKMTSLSMQNAKEYLEYMEKQNNYKEKYGIENPQFAIHFQYISSSLNQQNGMLLEQASYLIDQIPELVACTEYNTIANGYFAIGEILQADKYFKKSIEHSPKNSHNKALATLNYAEFLYNTDKIESADKNLTISIELQSEEDDFTTWSRGMAYQRVLMLLKNKGSYVEKQNELYKKAINEFEKISNRQAKEAAKKNLELSINKVNMIAK